MACRGLYLKIQKSCSVSGNTVVGHHLCQIIKVWCLSGLRSSAMNWDLWWELMITLNIWDAWMNRLTFVLRIKSTLLWRLSCLFAFPTKVDLSLVALCSAQSLGSACVRCVHLSKENHQLSRWAPEKSRYQLHHQPWEWFSKSWWSARFLTEPNKVMMLKSPARMRLKSFTTGSLTELPSGLRGAGNLHSTQVYSFTWSWILFSRLTFFLFKFGDPPSLHQRNFR